jgi:uncharacterized iron-regulated membrane protein
MKQKLYNIHKIIGINVALIFYICTFFGLLTIYKPYIHIWESPEKHFKNIEIKDIDIDKCFNKIYEYKIESLQDKSDETTVFLPNIIFTANNTLSLRAKGGIELDPYTCEQIAGKSFEIADFFEDIHKGNFSNLLVKILFGFASVAVLFLCLSGVFLILKVKYSNKKTTTSKGFFAKYHRLLLLYTIPLVLMFALTGALFNLGLYTSPLITNYLSSGETYNILKVEKNILQDDELEIKKAKSSLGNIDLNILYKKAKNEFEDISFYKMQVFNYKDSSSQVKFIGYEPKTYFLSSVYNETYILLEAKNGNIIAKKYAANGTDTEKIMDSLFYLHFLKSFEDFPRHIFLFLSLLILAGITFSLTLWLQRANKETVSYKILRPLIFSVISGSILASSILFASTYMLPIEYLFIQEPMFYITFLILFIYIKLKENIFKSFKFILYLSAFLLVSSVVTHDIFTSYSIITSYQDGLNEVFIMDCALLFSSIVLIILAIKLPEKFFKL